MPAGLDVDPRRFHPHRPPVMLLGGVNLVRAGERLASALGCTVPLFYGDDTYLGLVQENRGRLASHFDLFSWSDPRPFLRKLAGRLGSRLQRLWLSPAG